MHGVTLGTLQHTCQQRFFADDLLTPVQEGSQRSHRGCHCTSWQHESQSRRSTAGAASRRVVGLSCDRNSCSNAALSAAFFATAQQRAPPPPALPAWQHLSEHRKLAGKLPAAAPTIDTHGMCPPNVPPLPGANPTCCPGAGLSETP